MINEIDKLAWICIKEGRLLVARSKGKDTYYIPGGKREEGESDQVALMREIKEELSVDLVPETIEYVGIFKAAAHDKPSRMAVKITCFYADFTGEVLADAEIEEVTWLNFADNKKCSPVTITIMEWLKSQKLIE